MTNHARILEDDELQLVLQQLTGKHRARNQLLITLSHQAGMRVSELARLIYSNFVNANGAVQDCIRLSKSQTKGEVARTIWLNEKMRDVLQAWTDANFTGDTKGPVFVSQKGGAFSDNSLCQLMRNIYIEAGFTGASSHSGRRKFITTLHDRNVPLRHIQELVGHAYMSTTQTYIDAPDWKLKDAVAVL